MVGIFLDRKIQGYPLVKRIWIVSRVHVDFHSVFRLDFSFLFARTNFFLCSLFLVVVSFVIICIYPLSGISSILYGTFDPEI